MSITKPILLDETGQKIVEALNTIADNTGEKENSKIFGIRRSLSSTSPSWTRTDDSANFTVKASIGSDAGYSDFDNQPIYKDIYRETLGTGDVMVHIPKFYIERKQMNGYETIRISLTKHDGFEVHPSFIKNGVEVDECYIGAYKTVSGHVSKSGISPLVSLKRSDYRTNARAKGDGWIDVDIRARLLMTDLFLVEFATYDSQSALGQGWTSGNSASHVTGGADGVANLTGRASGTDGQTQVVYRGIEDPFGNVWEWTDGLNLISGAYYVSYNEDSYADDVTDGYEKLSYGVATNLSGAYITKMGFDADNADMALPTEASGGSSSTYMTDAIWASTSNRICAFGGDWGNGLRCGFLSVILSYASSAAHTYFGSRLVKR